MAIDGVLYMILTELDSYDSGVISTVALTPSFQQQYQFYPSTGAGYAVVPVSLAASFIASFVKHLLENISCQYFTYELSRYLVSWLMV
jgi:hypothetical protein